MIPVYEPTFTGNESRYLQECIETGWVSSEGPFIKRFEEGVASRVGAAFGVAVSNGTAALETAAFALDLPAGAEVIMPSFTIISCATACLRLGLKPVLVDIDPVHWTMAPEQVAARITQRTGAIMAVHIYGNPVDMDPILALSKKHGIPIIEDFAEVHGAGYFSNAQSRELLCGSMGDVAATSFYANKLISCGEGGMVLCKDARHAQRARDYRNLYFDKERRFMHEEVGFNYRMTNLQAAVGLAQLERLDETVAAKRRIGDLYRQALRDIPGIRFHPVPTYSNPVYWMYCIELTDNRFTADILAARLRTRGIGTRHFFRGMHLQPAFKKLGLFSGESYPHTERAGDYGLYLPSSITLDSATISIIANGVREAVLA